MYKRQAINRSYTLSISPSSIAFTTNRSADIFGNAAKPLKFESHQPSANPVYNIDKHVPQNHDVSHHLPSNAPNTLEMCIRDRIAGFKILATILKEYIDAVLKPETYYARNILSVMPEQYKVHQDDSIYTKIQTVTDYVSGMTDSYALNLYRKIKGIELPEIR